MDDEQRQRRLYSRIRFRARARLRCDTLDEECDVCDLSLKGALVHLDGALVPAVGARCTLELRLDADDAAISLEGEVAHAGDGRVGLVCREIDLDSATHLRRLLELNLGDAALLRRELSAFGGSEAVRGTGVSATRR